MGRTYQALKPFSTQFFMSHRLRESYNNGANLPSTKAVQHTVFLEPSLAGVIYNNGANLPSTKTVQHTVFF